jgi:signal transduction histidine kinase
MARLGGLRPRLTLLVATVVVVCMAIAFAAVYRGTVSRLTSRTDSDLRGDMAALRAGIRPGLGDPDGVHARAVAFLRQEPFRDTAHVVFVVVPGHRTLSNDRELSSASPAARAFIGGPPGAGFRRAPEAGRVRLLVQEVRRDGRLVARLGVGEPTAARDRAQHVVLDAFLVAGGIGVLAALLGGLVVASWVARPLRRMAGVAARVDRGDLAPRMQVDGRRDEVRVLGDAFDHMLDRLEEAFARQEAFVADASHELRTPLTVVRGQIELLALQDAPDPGDVRRVERIVMRELERMNRLVDDLLLLAQTGEEGFVRTEPVDLADLVDEALAGLRGVEERRLQVDGVPPLVVEADPDRLAQALRNLVRNGLAHTAPGGSVRIGVEHDAQAVRIVVDDDGPGIAPEDRERVFDRFQRTETGRLRWARGAGLGLAIVRAVAQAHGGRAWAADAPGGGARLVVELPLDAVADTDADAPAADG